MELLSTVITAERRSGSRVPTARPTTPAFVNTPYNGEDHECLKTAAREEDPGAFPWRHRQVNAAFSETRNTRLSIAATSDSRSPDHHFADVLAWNKNIPSFCGYDFFCCVSVFSATRTFRIADH